MSSVKALDPEELCRRCDLGALGFATTDEIENLEGILGQPRAIAAVEFGIGIEREGFNIFAHGPSGAGKHSAVSQFLRAKAEGAEVPPDLCYVNNFDSPHKPRLLQLPPGRGAELRDAMDKLVEELPSAVESALESDEYQTQRQILEQKFSERQGKAFSELGDRANEKGLALVRTPIGIVFAPMRDDEVLSPDETRELPDKERERLEKEVEHFKEELQKVLRQLPRWQREAREALRKLDLGAGRYALEPLVSEVRERFKDLDQVQAYLDAVENDVVENTSRLTTKETPSQESEDTQVPTGPQAKERPFVRRYRVNLLVDHRSTEGAPVVFEDNPAYQNLVGRVEHIPQMGAVVTDFGLIKAGALHRANGGYLLIEALKLLRNPFAYEGLKRALQAGLIKIESPGEALSLISTYSLEPEPAELNVKIVLIGDSRAYYLLSSLDPDFSDLFKVAADFGDRTDRSDENEELYARLIAKLVREEGLRAFERGAVERVVEHSSRSAGDSERMSLLMSRILDLLREADYWSRTNDGDTVTAEDVQRAIDAKIHRSDRIRERVQEEMVRQTILVDTGGEKVGQVNALSVLQLGDFAFGRPSRITARVRLGKGEVVDIEREVELSGPLHSKGVLILAGFLGARYAADRPLSLSASLVFEQSYGGIDGDSASSTELYALLSAISEIPIRQSLAVTGSVNQRGDVQAIGGVNEKIEGFFDLCAERGLTGDQGVLIPAANVKHLMLRRDVVEAAAAGRFHVYPVETVDQGIEILTGVPAGEADEAGEFPEGTVNRRVAARLAELAEARRSFAGDREAG